MGLNEAMQKKFGGGITTAAEKQYGKTQWLNTGSYVLNAAINYKARGLPTGNMIESFGDSASGKSVMAYHVLRNTIEQNGIAVLIDVEGAYDYDLGQSIGIDPTKLTIVNPASVGKPKKKKEKKTSKRVKKVEEEEEKKEEAECLVPLTLSDVFRRTEWAVQEVRRQYGMDKLLTIVWDTLAATPADEDIQEDTPKETMGAIQKRNKQWIKRIRPIVSTTNTLWLIINQVYSNITQGGMATAEPLKAPGGKAVRFNSEIRIEWVAKPGKAGKIFVPGIAFPVGARLHFKIDKNRVGPPWREGTVSWYFDKDGKPYIDYWSGYLDYLIKMGAVKTGTAKVIVGDDSYKAKQGEPKNCGFYETKYLEKMLKEHPELLEVQ